MDVDGRRVLATDVDVEFVDERDDQLIQRERFDGVRKEQSFEFSIELDVVASRRFAAFLAGVPLEERDSTL